MSDDDENMSGAESMSDNFEEAYSGDDFSDDEKPKKVRHR
jgi:hypothetical protein